MQTRRGLGRGLDVLIPPPVAISEVEVKASGFQLIPVDQIAPNRLQPRNTFDDEKLRELANSIKEDGVIQPLIVTPLHDGRYELIAGERRLRAARLAGLSQVPVVVKSVDEASALALSIIENIQREDLNPIEEAQAFQELINQFSLTQDEVSKRVGKSRATVANSLRLLNLPRVIQDDVASGRYSAGHARAILAVEGIHEQLKLREWIVKTTPTVRSVEKHMSKNKKAKGGDVPSQLAPLIERLREALGTKVRINYNRKGGGKLIIDYYSWQDLDRLYRRILGA